MYPTQFDYARADRCGRGVYWAQPMVRSSWLADTALIPAMKLRLSTPSTLVDIRLASLKGISKSSGKVKVGALIHHASCVMASSDLPTVWSEAAGLIGDPDRCAIVAQSAATLPMPTPPLTCQRCWWHCTPTSTSKAAAAAARSRRTISLSISSPLH